MKRIHRIDKVEWPFEGKPYVEIKTANHNQHENVDPFPCYSHDMKLVRKMVKEVEAVFPVEMKPHWNIMCFETIKRTNGWAGKDVEHNEKKAKRTPFHSTIMLSGKRIPLHPAMTRYLIAHEYGHVVEYHIRHKMGLEEYDFNTLRDEYSKMRGIKASGNYSSASWDMAPGEILANDFRIIVCGIEEEFWPHPIVHPLKSKKAQKWWESALNKESA